MYYPKFTNIVQFSTEYITNQKLRKAFERKEKERKEKERSAKLEEEKEKKRRKRT